MYLSNSNIFLFGFSSFVCSCVCYFADFEYFENNLFNNTKTVPIYTPLINILGILDLD